MCGVFQVKEARGNVKNYLFNQVKENDWTESSHFLTPSF